MVLMSDSAFNDDELEKELFGGGSNDLDDLGGFGDGDDDDEDGVESIAAAAVATAAASPAADSVGAGSSAAAEAQDAGVEAKLKNAQGPKLDIELDDPPGELTVLAHPPKACRSATGEP
ncbi:hypothetical protein H4R21_005038, partial [Coemansia helicoidea]